MSVNIFPTELIVHIFRFLPDEKKVKYSVVCKHWYSSSKFAWPYLFGSLNEVIRKGSKNIVKKIIKKNVSEFELICSQLTFRYDNNFLACMEEIQKFAMDNIIATAIHNERLYAVNHFNHKFYGYWCWDREYPIYDSIRQGNFEIYKCMTWDYGESTWHTHCHFSYQKVVDALTSEESIFNEKIMKDVCKRTWGKMNSDVYHYMAFKAVCNNKSSIVKHVLQKYPLSIFGALKGAAFIGNIKYFQSMLLEMKQNYHISQIHRNIEEAGLEAVKSGQLKMLEFILTSKPKEHWSIGYKNQMLNMSAQYNQINILEYLIKRYTYIPENLNDALESAIKGGQLEMIKFLQTKNACFREILSFENAIEYDYLEIVKYIASEMNKCGNSVSWNILFDIAIKYNRLQILKYIIHESIENKIKLNINDALMVSSENGYLKITKYLLRIANQKLSWNKIIKAAINGESLKTVKYLITQYISMENQEKLDWDSLLHTEPYCEIHLYDADEEIKEFIRYVRDHQSLENK